MCSRASKKEASSIRLDGDGVKFDTAWPTSAVKLPLSPLAGAPVGFRSVALNVPESTALVCNDKPET